MTKNAIQPAMIRKTLTMVAISALLVLLPVAAAADATPYLEKMMAGYEKPFEMVFSIDMTMNQSGMSMAVSGAGDMTWADATHSEMNMKMDMNMPGMDAPMAMGLKTVSDGEVIWTEMANPMTGTQVMKISVSDVKDMAASQGIGGAFGSNPLEQLKAMQAFFDFEVAGIEGGVVTLSGSVRDDAPSMFAEAGDMMNHMTITMDQKTGVLQTMMLGAAEQPMMTMTVDRYTQLTKEDVPLSRFSYTPPEGALMMSSPVVEGQTP